MRVIELEDSLQMEELTLQPKVSYACEDQQVWQIAHNCVGHLNVNPLFKEYFMTKGEYEKDSVLIVRSGAAGDLLFMKPAIQALLDKGKKVTIALMSRYKWCYETFKGVNIIDFPVTLNEEVKKYENTYILEYTGEKHRGAHPTDLFARHLGVTLSNRKPSYEPLAAHLERMQRDYPRTERKRIGITVHSTSPARNYDQKLMYVVVDKLVLLGHEVAFIGFPRSVTCNKHPQLINLTQREDLTWQEQVAFIKTCDVFVGGDSGNTHYAGAMDVPTVALYGSFDWKDRTSVFPSVRAIQANLGCDKAPCYHHPTNLIMWVKGAPCEKSGRCECLATIPPERIVAEVKKML